MEFEIRDLSGGDDHHLLRTEGELLEFTIRRLKDNGDVVPTHITTAQCVDYIERFCGDYTIKVITKQV